MNKRKINFISNLPLSEISGGWSGINYRIHQELQKYFEVNYIGPINPKSNLIEKAISKFKRLLGLKGRFHFFSSKRLNRIKCLVDEQLKEADYNFFFGQTPWINCDFDTPYGVYMDAAFPTYMEIYSQPKKFEKKDLMRIAQQEERWLQNASHIFVGSEWAWFEMVKHYRIDNQKKVVVWLGGNVEILDRDCYTGSRNLLFISLNFEKKGGFQCVETFTKLKTNFSDLTLTIVGQRPPQAVMETPGVIYAGLLDKNKKVEYEKFIDILKSSFLLIHPTKMDTMGAVILEAGYFGCPTIAPAIFGIPELIKDGQTGFLLPHDFKVKNIIDKVSLILDDHVLYKKMRKNVRGFTINERSYLALGKRIQDSISL